MNGQHDKYAPIRITIPNAYSDDEDDRESTLGNDQARRPRADGLERSNWTFMKEILLEVSRFQDSILLQSHVAVSTVPDRRLDRPPQLLDYPV